MKKNLYILAILFLIQTNANAQITQAFARGNVGHVSYQHLELDGEKILVIDTNYVNWTLFNLNNTVYSTGTLPTIISTDFSYSQNCLVERNKLKILVTQNLFNLDNQIEFLYSSTRPDCYGNSLIFMYTPKTIIFDASGSIIFSKTKYTLANIFNLNASSVMILSQANYEIIAAGGTSVIDYFPSDSILVYNLPGQLNCSNCNLNNPVSNLINSGNQLNKASFNVFPNPFNDNVSIEYNIPNGSVNPIIEIFDALGKSIKKINLQDTEGKLLLNSTEFSKGIYFYVISANGEIILDKKMIKFE
jgi:hypothetical protein